MPAVAVVDTGPLVALADARDDYHDVCVTVLETTPHRLVIPALVVAEVSYLIQSRLGSQAEERFLAGLSSHEVVAPESYEWRRIAELVREYADFPLGGTDASVVALAERLKTDVVITLDRRHFGAVRPRHCAALRLLPD